MKKQTKVFILQFAIFGVIFLILRYLIVLADLFTGFWIPLTAAIFTSILCPQFKVFSIDGKEEVYAAWLFRRKPIKVKWL